MIRVIMHGCNGKMGQVISGLIAADPQVEMVAGIDVWDDGHNTYPVFADINDCDVEADCLIDFSTAGAVERCWIIVWQKSFPVCCAPQA